MKSCSEEGGGVSGLENHHPKPKGACQKPSVFQQAPLLFSMIVYK
jgi:hypothetical protein